VAPPPQKHTISLARRISLVSRPCPLKCKPYPASLQHCTDLLPVQASMSDTEEAAAPQARVCALHSSHMRAPTVYFRHICARPPSIFVTYARAHRLFTRLLLSHHVMPCLGCRRAQAPRAQAHGVGATARPAAQREGIRSKEDRPRRRGHAVT
jgi:hypothetical protein